MILNVPAFAQIVLGLVVACGGTAGMAALLTVRSQRAKLAAETTQILTASALEIVKRLDKQLAERDRAIADLEARVLDLSDQLEAASSSIRELKAVITTAGDQGRKR